MHLRRHVVVCRQAGKVDKRIAALFRRPWDLIADGRRLDSLAQLETARHDFAPWPLAGPDLRWRRASSIVRSMAKAFAPKVHQQLIRLLTPATSSFSTIPAATNPMAIRDAIKAAGSRLALMPKYSHDLNPIEKPFAKIKPWMRQAQKRTIEDTWCISNMSRHH